MTPTRALLMAETTELREPPLTGTLAAVMEPALSPPVMPTVTVPPEPELSTTDVVPVPDMSDTVVEVPSTLITPSVPETADPADRPRVERLEPPVICREAPDPCSVVAMDNSPDVATEAVRVPPEAA